MSELISFSSIDEYGEEFENLGEGTREAVLFLYKMDWEGGIDGLLGYGGAEVFPEELQGLAEAANVALKALQDAVNDWAAKRGVSY